MILGVWQTWAAVLSLSKIECPEQAMPTNPGLRIAPELTKEAHLECSVCRTSSLPEPHTAASAVTGLPLAAALFPRSCPPSASHAPSETGASTGILLQRGI